MSEAYRTFDDSAAILARLSTLEESVSELTTAQLSLSTKLSTLDLPVVDPETDDTVQLLRRKLRESEERAELSERYRDRERAVYGGVIILGSVFILGMMSTSRR